MKSGAVLVDIAIDQGGCFEDSRPTTHDDPTFAVHDTVFYCVANMPGAVPRTSTYALTNATMPYVLKLADKGWQAACAADPALAKGLSTHEGALLSEQVAADLGLPFTDPATCSAEPSDARTLRRPVPIGHHRRRSRPSRSEDVGTGGDDGALGARQR